VFNPAWVEHQLGELRPSFYAGALRAWHDSADSDPSYFLRGQALEDAEIWAKGKQLSGEDLRFLEVSRQHNIQEIQHNLEEIQWQLDRKAERNEILTAAREQAEQESEVASQQLRIIKEEVQRLQSSREYEKQQMQHQQEANRALAAAREQVEKDLNTINQQLLTTKAEIQRQRQEKATATKILTETQDQLRSLTLERNQVEKILDTKNQELDNIKQELSQNKARFSRTLKNSKLASILFLALLAFFASVSSLSVKYLRNEANSLANDISEISKNIINLNFSPSPGYSKEKNSPMDPELLATTLYMAQYFKKNPDPLENNNNQKISDLLKERLKSFREFRINTEQNIVRSIGWIELPGEEPILASGGQDGTVKLWKQTGEPLKTPELSNQNVLFQNQEGYVQSMSWNGKQLATVHKAKDQSMTLSLSTEKGGKYESVNITIKPDSPSKPIFMFSKVQWIREDVLLTLDTQDNLRLWRLDNNSNILTEILQKLPIQKIKSFSWSEASQILATGDIGGHLNLWKLSDVSDELQFSAFLKEAVNANQGSPIWSISWRQDGKGLATGGSDGTIKFWKANDKLDQDEKYKYINTGQGVVWYILWEKDNKTLITGGADGSIKFWDINDPSKPKKTIQTFQGSISGMSLTQDEKTLATIGTDQTIKLWLLEPEKIPDDTSLDHLIKLSCKQLSSYLESRPDAKDILKCPSID
jgi:WD40 repeat protein